MIEKLFQASGNKIGTLVVSEKKFKFSSERHFDLNTFHHSFFKKISFATKLEIPTNKIKYITKEDKKDAIIIHYISKITIPMTCEFTINDVNEYENFTFFLENDLRLKKINEVKSPYKSSFPSLFIAFFIMALTYLGDYRLDEINNGTASLASSTKSQLFDKIITFLGTTGLFIIGGSLTLFLVFKATIRFSNPPNETKWIFRNLKKKSKKI